MATIPGKTELWAHYAVYPDVFFHDIAVRVDGPHRERVGALVAAQWQAAYPGHAMADCRAERDP